ncbi:MAG: acetyltransferase [Microbacteriaceae bacterium]|nr:acetyltransferase [Microbacteriaceae bacterium]
MNPMKIIHPPPIDPAPAESSGGSGRPGGAGADTTGQSDLVVQRAGRMPGLDGLRAIAVGVVILYHLGPGIAVGGYLGVDIFFVLSGFLITGLLLRERAASGGIRLGRFWLRRARRLIPAIVALLLVCCTAAWIVGGDVLVELGRQVLGAATFSSNWLAIANDRSYFEATAPELLRNLWSLAVEEQFYLVWPFVVLLLVLVRRRRVRLWIVAGLAIASATAMAMIYVPGSDATRVYYGTDTHSFGLAVGAALAILVERWSSHPTGWPRLARLLPLARVLLPLAGALAVAALVAAAILVPADAPLVYRGGLAAVSLITAVAIAGAIVPGSLLGRMLDLAPIRWVGERSYGLYLWHWPVFVLVIAALPNWPRIGEGEWGLAAIAFVITVAAATLSYRFIEQPIRRDGFRASIRSFFAWRRRRPIEATSTSPVFGRAWPRMIGAAIGMLLIAATGAGTAVALSDDPVQTDAATRIEQGQAAISREHSGPTRHTGAASTAPSRSPSAAPSPSPAALPGGDQITAIGDSVMLASAPGLQAAFPGIQIDAVVSRQMLQLPGIVQSMKDAATLRPILIIGLGTNGPIERSSLDQVRQIAGPRTQIVLVNVQAPRGWTDGVDQTLSLFAQQYRNVELANWRDAIAGHLDLLASDQIHPGTRGGLIYAGVIKDALQRLAELPPLLGPNQYGLAPTPL